MTRKTVNAMSQYCGTFGDVLNNLPGVSNTQYTLHTPELMDFCKRDDMIPDDE